MDLILGYCMRLPACAMTFNRIFDLWNWFWTAKDGGYVTRNHQHNVFFSLSLHNLHILFDLVEWFHTRSHSFECSYWEKDCVLFMEFVGIFRCFTFAASWISDCCAANFLEIISIERWLHKGLINLARWRGCFHLPFVRFVSIL